MILVVDAIFFLEMPYLKKYPCTLGTILHIRVSKGCLDPPMRCNGLHFPLLLCLRFYLLHNNTLHVITLPYMALDCIVQHFHYIGVGSWEKGSEGQLSTPPPTHGRPSLIIFLSHNDAQIESLTPNGNPKMPLLLPSI